MADACLRSLARIEKTGYEVLDYAGRNNYPIKYKNEIIDFTWNHCSIGTLYGM